MVLEMHQLFHTAYLTRRLVRKYYYKIYCKYLYRLLLNESFTITTYEPRREIVNNVVWSTSKGSDKPAHARSLPRAFASHLNIL